MLGSVVDGEPQLQLILDIDALLTYNVSCFLNVDGGTVDTSGFDLGSEVFLVAEVILEDSGVEAAETGPWLSDDGEWLESWSDSGCNNRHNISRAQLNRLNDTDSGSLPDWDRNGWTRVVDGRPSGHDIIDRIISTTAFNRPNRSAQPQLNSIAERTHSSFSLTVH